MTTPRRISNAPRVPKAKRVDVTRAEFDRAIDLLKQHGDLMTDLRHNLDVQFKRIAAMQTEIDRLKSLAARKAPGARDS